ncbi:MAG TPA: hypothetical protein VHD81_06545 [Mycobacteriales bacterium]|nr:hypothetical protein [Mycobacteriales bacterium]
MRSTHLPRLFLLAALGSVALPVPVLLSSAHAAAARTITVPVSQASWFWRGQPGAIGSTGIAPPAQVPDASVPNGDLAVAGPEAPAAAGLPAGPVAETYLAFDLAQVPVGSTITSFVVTLPVDAKGVSADPIGASMIACPVRTGWAGGLQASAYGGKPTDGCDVHSPKLRAAGGGDHYTVDITDLAQRWVTPNALNLGVAITDNPANSTTIYQVVFGPASALAHLAASVTYIPPEPQDVPPPTAGGAVVPRPAPAPTPGHVPVITFEPLPPGMPAEVAQPPAPTVAPVTPVVAMTVQPGDSSAPPLGFWIALILIVLLLGTTTFVLADPRNATAIHPDRGVAKALRSRLTTMRR